MISKLSSFSFENTCLDLLNHYHKIFYSKFFPNILQTWTQNCQFLVLQKHVCICYIIIIRFLTSCVFPNIFHTWAQIGYHFALQIYTFTFTNIPKFIDKWRLYMMSGVIDAVSPTITLCYTMTFIFAAMIYLENGSGVVSHCFLHGEFIKAPPLVYFSGSSTHKVLIFILQICQLPSSHSTERGNRVCLVVD